METGRIGHELLRIVSHFARQILSTLDPASTLTRAVARASPAFDSPYPQQ